MTPIIPTGTRLDGKYRIARRLGGGGFGEVFLAGDEVIVGRQVAIKVLTQAKDDDPVDERRTALVEIETPVCRVPIHEPNVEAELSFDRPARRQTARFEPSHRNHRIGEGERRRTRRQQR